MKKHAVCVAAQSRACVPCDAAQEHFWVLSSLKAVGTELKGSVWHRAPKLDVHIIAIGCYL